MKIGIDARMLNYSGIGVRIESFLKQINKTDTKMFEFTLFGNTKELQILNLSQKFKIIEYNCKIYSLKEFLGHPQMKDMDILDIPHFNVPIRFLRKCVVTIHDLIPITMKKFHSSAIKQMYLKIIFYLIKKFAKRVISVSEHTKNDLVNLLKFSQDQIITIYNGIDHSRFKPYPKKELFAFKKIYNLPDKFFLSVGIGKKHKNLEFLIENLAQLHREKKINIPLVLCGLTKENKSILLQKYSNVQNLLIFLPKLPFEELPFLYNSATLFIYPSLYEGFGFPVLEASACNCPIFSSNTSVLPEVLKETAYYFNPTDSENFMIELMFILKNNQNLRKNVEAAYQNSQSFTWKKSVDDYFNLLKLP